MERINFNNFSDESLTIIKNEYIKVFNNILKDLYRARDEISEVSNQVKVKNVKVTEKAKKIGLAGLKLAINALISHKLKVDPMYLDNDINFLRTASPKDKNRYYINCPIERLAELCINDIEKGINIVLNYLNSSDKNTLIGIMNVIENFCIMNYNIDIIPQKYDWGLLVMFCGKDNAVPILDMDCYDRISFLHKNRDANLDLRYNYLADLKRIHRTHEYDSQDVKRR